MDVAAAGVSALDELSASIDAAAAAASSASPVASCLRYAALLLQRYALAGDLADVDAAIGAAELAATKAGDDRRTRAIALNVLANARAAAFGARGGHAEISAALAVQREAVALLDTADPDRAALEANLVERLLAAHTLTPDPALVAEAVRLGEDILARDLPGDWRAAALDGLGRALRARHVHTGDRADLERSAAAQAQSLALTPAAAPERAARLNNLANARWASYQSSGDLGDLDDAVARYQEAAGVATYPAARAACLLGLGSARWARWSRHRTGADLDAAVTAYEQALSEVEADSPTAAHCRLDLGAAFLARWRDRGRPADLDTAIDHWTSARTAAAAEPAVVGAATANLGAALWERYETRGDVGDLDAAVDLLRTDTPTPGRQFTLAGALRRRHDLRGNPADRTEGLAGYRAACVAGLASDPAVALAAGQRWGSWATVLGRLAEADEAYRTATAAALRLYARQATEAHVRVWLGEAVGLAAAQAWVQCRRDQAAAAVLTLERGRAYLLSEALSAPSAGAGSGVPLPPGAGAVVSPPAGAGVPRPAGAVAAGAASDSNW
ncbi:MAG: hypothetical protein AB7V44_01045 [Pseudonocardia sp.]